MSDYTMGDSSSAQQQHGNDATLHNTSLDDQNAANNSIIGKVKSRVSSILPNSLSKWFSPSSKLSNEAYNGGTLTSGNVARRRRRIEIEDDEDENFEDEYQGERGEYEENHNLVNKKEDNSENEDEDNDDDDDDDDSQNSEEEYNATLAAQKVRHTATTIRDRQPPTKRSRLSTDIRDSPLLASRQPLIASTPAVSSGLYSRSSIGGTITSATRSSTYQRYTNLNLYRNTGKKEPAYNFGQHQNIGSPKTNTDIIDLITNSNETSEKILSQTNAYARGGISNRRSLNIPSSTSGHNTTTTIPQLKRQPLSISKCELSASSSPAGVPPRRTSTTIHEVRDCEENSEHDDDFPQYNGQTMAEKQIGGHINGSELNRPNINEKTAEGTVDTASESGESGSAYITKSMLQNPQRKTGLFNTNMSAVTTRNSSRTSSFGNGLNFYSHLEGRKSLFTGQGHGDTNQINNSTLSLTSLNRRQFNASIYGSTSALSDSRLLNTFSPFYKGKTTYGGAAAYNKYSASSGGANAVRITPTLIRPTSSLSTLSSSSCSLSNNTQMSHHQQQQIGDSATISSTAKRILDLINDFATPLGDAKKMANNIKMTPSAGNLRDRLNENDLNTSRAIRLSQVRTPYSRPSVILQPSGNANTSIRGGPQPPVKELQVPTMSQLLQMKKIQTTTEKMRTITRDNSHQMSEYTLPTNANESTKFASKTKTTPPPSQTKEGFDQEPQQQQQQQKHTNKIKNKVSNTLRASAASKDIQDEAPPPSVNLPTLAFPLMQSVPKFDIQFSSVASTNESTTTVATTTSATTKVPTIQTAFNTKTTSVTTNNFALSGGVDSIYCKPANMKFKFSEPLVVKENTHQSLLPSTSTSIIYKFSPPMAVSCPAAAATKPLQQQPQLRTTGSCLDVFNKPLGIPSTTAISENFGDKFKKSSNNWECETCMVRNELSNQKCVACETPRKVSQVEDKTATPSTLTLSQQFKKSSSEWECDSCMVRNKEDSKKCVACETPRKAMSSVSAPPSTVKNTFGDAFKPKSGTWECPTCMISNKNDHTKCVACESSKPGFSNATSTAASTAVTSTFKFGFSTPQIASKELPAADSGFQTIVAQQKAAKWECDACMTRNDSERTKCACCEQPKPGSNANNDKSSFSFGATSAAKFSFGFGTASKEEDLRKENAMNATNKTSPSFGTLPATSTASSVGGFQFGFKSTTDSTADVVDKNTEKTDAKNKPAATATVGFKFDSSSNNNKDNVSEITSSKPAINSGFSFGNKLNTTNPTSTAAGQTLSFNSPTTSSTTSSSTISFDVNKASDNVGVKTNLTSASNASSTTEGFSFGAAAKKQETSSSIGGDKKLPLQEFAFKTPAAVSSSSSTTTTNKLTTPTTTSSTEFVFGINTKSSVPTTAAAAICNTTTATTSSTGVSTAAVKPMFSFGSTAALSQGTAAVSTTPATGFGGFSFNNQSTSASTFGAVTSSTSSNTATTTSTSSSSTASASTTPSIFGSFGGKNTSSPLTFGSTSAAASNANPANSSTTVSSSTSSSSSSSFSLSAKPTFGSFGGTTSSSTPTAATTNVFGSFGGTSGGSSSQIPSSSQTQQNKPIASVLGNIASSKNSSNSNVTSASNNTTSTFVFGSAATNAPAGTSLASAATTTWPKNNFVFGSGVSSAAATATTTNTTQSTNVSTDSSKPPSFWSFNSGTDNTSNQQATLSTPTSSIFGSANASSNLPLATPPSFGSAAALGSSTGTTNLFASANVTPVASNIFGANHSGNAATPAPSFGSSPFGGGSASSTSAIPTFGSTAAMTASSTSFGGFGAPASKTTNGPETKKTEPAFSFGSANQNPSGGFNFSSSSAKPAFNFGSTSATQATFNFTGSTESQNSTKPFEFGATPSAPVFNFGGGNAAIETTPNAPFQFNAGSVPVSSNIFAPAPTPGTQTAQQAKRKIRAPLKRVTQR